MPVTTSPILGPLTTVFTPPSGCLSTVTYSPASVSSGTAELYLGASGNAVDLECYPPAFQTDCVYSPGVCPSGWSSACVPSTQSGGSGSVFSSGTTGVQCCPSGLTCWTYQNHLDYAWCEQAPTNTERVVWSLSSDRFGNEGEGILVTTSIPSMVVFAKPILLAYQAGDETPLSAATTTAASTLALLTGTSSRSSSTSTTTASASSSGAAISSKDSGLSAGAKAGIGVGVAVGAVLILALIFGLFRWKRATRSLWGKTELPGDNQRPYELGADQQHR